MPFRDVVGHRVLVSLLSRSIAREALPPSLIFAGPAGVGKRLLAGAVAQALNCLRPVSSPATDRPAADACGVCTACSRIARGVHPDVLVIEPDDKGSIKVDPVRDLIDRAGFRPFEGRRRVAIVDEADTMVTAAQNALLKTLEEPPSASVFVLVTSRPDLLLPTVQSRCPRLRFQPLTVDDVVRVLVGLGENETRARVVAATADGSIARASAEDADGLVESRGIAMRVLVEAVTSDDPRRRVEMAKALVAKAGSGSASDRQMLASHLRVMASLIRDAGLLGAGGPATALANADLGPALARLTALAGDRGEQAFLTVNRGLAALERNAGVKTVADWVALNL